jgi:hypothetical protein
LRATGGSEAISRFGKKGDCFVASLPPLREGGLAMTSSAFFNCL